MATELLVIARPAVTRQPQGPVIAARLRGIHRHWLEETRDWLAPAIAPEADFWNGWSAVRYLGDQFARFYRRQLAFVRAILPLVGPSDAFALAASTARVERVRRTLDRLGRRQDMVKVVAAACLYFLRLLEEWFEQIQQLTHGITREELPESARAVVSQLQTAILSRAEAPSLTHPLRQGQAWLRR